MGPVVFYARLSTAGLYGMNENNVVAIHTRTTARTRRTPDTIGDVSTERSTKGCTFTFSRPDPSAEHLRHKGQGTAEAHRRLGLGLQQRRDQVRRELAEELSGESTSSASRTRAAATALPLRS